jgi:hypothetical protein
LLLEELEDATRTRELAVRDLDALRSVGDWITSYVARPHKDIGRTGTVCPFVPGSLERQTLWLAPEQMAGQSVPDVARLMNGYKRLLLDAEPVAGDDAIYKSIVVVATDLSAERAKGLFGSVLEQLAIPWYAEDGVVLGAFYESNEGTALYNKNFRPFRSPVPFLLVRPAVLGDWKFFMDDERWLDVWARRWGAAAVHALAAELRRLPWRVAG